MRRHRRYFVPPPVDAEHVTGEGHEFRPERDLVNAGKPPLPTVEFLGTGTGAATDEPTLVFKPEHDRVAAAAKSARHKAERRAAFLAELERCNTVEGVVLGSEDRALQIRQWKDVIPEPSVWGPLTKFLSRSELVDSSYHFLAFGRVPLANHLLTINEAAANGCTFKKPVLRWLSENWRGEWGALSDEAKRALVEHFAKQADRWADHAEGMRDALSELGRAFRGKD